MPDFAVIFDMDGVISDTQKFHSAVESALLKRHGIEMSPDEITHRYSGYATAKMFEELFAAANLPAPDINALTAEKYDRLIAMATGNIVGIPGIAALVRMLADAGVPLAVASASRPDFIRLVLSSLEIESCFHHLTSGREVEHGKPAPDIFLLAATRLGVEPDRCVVIEDANNGVRAAKAAGMKCVGFQGNPPSSQDLSLADLVVDDFFTLDPLVLRSLPRA